MIIRQSDLKRWSECALKWRYENLDEPQDREQSGALTFGTLVHAAVLRLETSRDLQDALDWFREAWVSPESVDPELQIDYFNRGSSWVKYRDEGPKIIRDWWALIQWDTDTVLAREYPFYVPISDGHTLHGTVDKLAIRYLAKLDQYAILISDYKTNRKTPTYDYLAEDLQFTAYEYASLQPEFWTGIPKGEEIFAKTLDYPRYGEWVQLRGPKRMDAGTRSPAQYNRLIYACDQMALSVGMRIFVPTISGESCRYCEHRRRCGLEPIPE